MKQDTAEQIVNEIMQMNASQLCELLRHVEADNRFDRAWVAVFRELIEQRVEDLTA